MLRRARYEKWYGRTHPSIHFDGCVGAQDAFILQHIYPHLAEQEAAGVFRAFADELDAFSIRPFEPRYPPTGAVGEVAAAEGATAVAGNCGGREEEAAADSASAAEADA